MPILGAEVIIHDKKTYNRQYVFTLEYTGFNAVIQGKGVLDVQKWVEAIKAYQEQSLDFERNFDMVRTRLESIDAEVENSKN